MINNFYAPLTDPLVILKFLLILLCWEILGAVIWKLLKSPLTLRPAAWIIGAGFWISLWFFAHWYLPFNNQYLWLSLILLTLPSLLFYLKNKLWQNLINRDLLIVGVMLIFFIVPIIKPLFYYSSLPPRIWDDLAYHVQSPSQVSLEKTWNFASILQTSKYDYYSMMPRFLETGFILLFALTHSYAPGQAMQLLLILTVVLVGALIIKKRISLFGSLIFIIFFLYLNTDVLVASTSAYIDTGAAALSLLFFFTLLETVMENKDQYLVTAALFAGLAAGTKYSTLTFMIASSATFSLLWLKSNFQMVIKPRINKQFYTQKIALIAKSVLLVMFFGGYWYVKNWLMTGSLIFPFGNCTDCLGDQFIEGWGYLPFNFANWPTILTATFMQNWQFYLLTMMGLGLAIVLAGYKKNLVSLKFLLFCLITLSLEVLIASQVSLYSERFFYHWKLIIPLLLAMVFLKSPAYQKPAANNSNAVLVIMWLTWLMLLYHFVWPMAKINRDKLHEMSNIDATEQFFVRGNIKINDWLATRFTNTYPLISWCGEQEQLNDVYAVDPQIIWNWDGLARAFFINCRLKSIALQQYHQSDLESILANYRGQYIWSNTGCQDKILVDYGNDYKQSLAELNNDLVCRAQPVVDQLYKLP